jgi:dynactin-4
MGTCLLRSGYPERIPLQTKLTKRCPHPACSHLLIQPDTKSTRFKLKMVAANYLPVVEIGRRRRRIEGGPSLSVEDAEGRRRERRKVRGRGEEVDESIDAPLRPGEIVSWLTMHILMDSIHTR